MKILVCTVGGSHKPILTALAAGWDRVVFVCTEDDPTKKQAGSIALVRDRVEAHGENRAEKTILPPIPEQAGLDPAAWSSLIVPADDPQAVYVALIATLDDLLREHPEAEIVVDYTGGTKSMSAGAVLAVAFRPRVRPQITSGERSDLVRVVDGTQQAVARGTDRIVLDRQIELLRETWRGYGYQEAAQGFRDIVPRTKATPDLHARVKFWADLGERLAAWDRFDRGQVVNNIRKLRDKLPGWLRRYADLAEQLRDDTEKRNSSALLLLDLLRNAERCAARGRYDDAVARCYRLWEWTAQWLLRADSGIDTSNVDPTLVPAGFLTEEETKSPDDATKSRRIQIASARAWSLYRELNPTREATLFWERMDSTGSTVKSHRERYRNLGEMRNLSILAHGARPISAADSVKILAWTAGPFIDMVRAEARRLGEPDDVPQLPTDLPEPLAAADRG